MVTARRFLPAGAFLIVVVALATLMFQQSGTPADAVTSPPERDQDAGPASEIYQGLMGDVDCNIVVDPIDSLKILRYDAGLSVTQNDPARTSATSCSATTC